MRILITGSHGLVGSPLFKRLQAEGHEVIRLVRAPTASTETMVLWNPESSGEISHRALENLDAVIHLAGENVAGRWTPEKKHRIRNSRVQGTGVLAQALLAAAKKPKVFLSASATGFYGDRGDEWLNEQSSRGKGFLSFVCRDWEAAATPLQQADIRVVCMRLGVVLSPTGGALGKMVQPFRLGLGGPLGSGRQYCSWIHMEDVVRAILFLLQAEPVRGPVNLVSPNPVTNRELAKTLGRVLRRPAVLRVPASLIEMGLGQMAVETILASSRVAPTVLQQHGFNFSFPDLQPALENLLVP